ncbi:Zinc finger domain containing protein [Entamoeba marina]
MQSSDHSLGEVHVNLPSLSSIINLSSHDHTPDDQLNHQANEHPQSTNPDGTDDNRENVNDPLVEGEPPVENQHPEQEHPNNDYESSWVILLIIGGIFFLNHIFTCVFILVDIIQHSQLSEAFKEFIYTGENKTRIFLLVLPSIGLFFIRIYAQGLTSMYDISYVPEDFVGCLLYLYFNDVLLRYLNYFLKVGITTTITHVVLLCKFYSMVESITLALRQIIPCFILYNYLITLQVWNISFIHTYIIPFITWIYIISRVFMFSQILFHFIRIFNSFFTKNNIIGQRVDPTELEDDTCLICQDSITNPIQLKCGHVFCEECIFKWLVQQPRCPLCRKMSVPNQSFVGFDGYTQLFPTYYSF